jgi:hypothetical protein
MGWWRRNRWGLIALVPALLATLALSAENLYYRVYAQQPRTPIPANANGSYELRATQIRLVDLGPATDLKQYDGSAFVAPPSVTIWRARIEFTAPTKTEIGGCTITLEDSAGRIFDDDPTDLLAGARDVVSYGCAPDFDAPDSSRYVNSIYFALPRDGRPVAIRINDVLTLPGYVRLSPP